MTWNYPWQPDEDPDHKTGEVDQDGCPARLRDDHGYYLWFTAMRKKYGYPRAEHVPTWEPRFKDWVAPATGDY